MKTLSISVHRRFLAGPISPFVAVLLLTAKSALAQSVWTGATSTDWNDPANWTAGVPTGVNATINLNTPNVATITANVPTPVDILIGNGGGTTGQVNQTAGAVSTGGGNWMFVGRAGGSGTYNQSGGTAGATRLLVGSDGGTGFYNVANTGSTGGPLTGFGLGAGGLTIGNRLYVGGNSEGSALGGTGTMNINTTGTIAIGNDLALGTGGGTGTVNMDAGTVTTGGWNFIGKDENGSNGKGTLNIGGGLLNNGGGRTYVGFGNAAGRMVMSGGEYRNTGEFFVVGHNNLANATASSLAMTGGTVNANLFTVGGDGDNAGKGFVAVNGATAQINAGGELWVGQGNGSRGLMDVNAGTVSSNNWLAVGRSVGSAGVLNVSGTGTVRMTAGNSRFFIIGSVGGTGILNMLGGTLEATNGGDLRLSEQGGTGTANLNGGVVKVDRITDNGATSYLYMNGGTMQARIASTTYLEGIDNAVVGAAGALFDTNGNVITVNQTLSAPTGAGVSSIPVLTGGTGYLGRPIVQISGDGIGASAIANVTAGVVTGIAITNPGIGYTSATVTIDDGGGTGVTLDAPVFAANTVTGGLVKSGNGTLILGSPSNSYGGANTITGGTLSVANLFDAGAGGSPSNLGASSNAATNLIFNGGALQYTGVDTSTDRNFTINAGKTAIFDVSAAGVILTLTGGSAATNGGLTKIGNGTLSLAGTNLHTGITTVNGGVLAASGTHTGGFAVGSTGHLTAASLAVGTLTVPTLALGAGSNVDFEFGGAATLNAGHDVISIANASGLTFGSTGLYLYQTGGTSPFTTNGTYTLFDYTTAFTGVLNTSFSIANSQVGKVYGLLNNTTATTIELTIATATSSVWATNGGGLWTTGANWTGGVPNSLGAIATFGSILTAANAPANITVNGPKTVGVIVFGNANTYNINGGAGDAITLNNGFGTPLISQLNGNHTIAAPLILVASNTSAAAFAGTTLTISGAISGIGALNAVDAGNVVLTGANSYGATGVTAGILSIGNGGTAGSLGSGTVTLGAAGTLWFNRSNAISVGNNISGPGVLTHIGAGTMTYTGVASHTGTTSFSAGPFINEGSITGTSTLDVENATTLRLSSSISVAGPLLVANNAAATASLTIQDSATAAVTGVVTVAGGAGSFGSLTIAGSGLLTSAGLNVGNGGTGDLNMSGGTLNGGNIFIGNNSNASMIMSAGTVSANQFVIGNGGNATANMTAGTVRVSAWHVIGRLAGVTGTFTQSGGQLNQNHTDFLTIGEDGNGTYTMNGTAVLNSQAVVDTSSRGTNKGNVIVGRNNGSVGVWDVSGNAVARIRELLVGGGAGSDGRVNISGGASIVSPDFDLFLGRDGVGRVDVNGGTMSFNQGWVFIGQNASGNGTLNVNGGTFGSQRYYVGDNGTGKVNVTAGMLTATGDFILGSNATANGTFSASGGISNLQFLNVGQTGLGTMNLSGTAVVNAVRMSVANGNTGTVTQTGGTLALGGGDSLIGAGAGQYGSYTQTAGTLTTAGNFQIGGSGTGVLDISGTGSVTNSGGFPVVGRFAGGMGLLNVSSGSFNQATVGNLFIIGEAGAGVVNVSATGTLVVAGGPGAAGNAGGTGGIRIGQTASGIGELNIISGGVVTASGIAKSDANGVAAVYLNGGTLKANATNATFLQGLDRVTIGAGGAKFDTNGNNITIGQTLSALSGQGVTTIPIVDGGSGYLGQPIVQISGDGRGATAVASINGLGVVTAITITNPGIGYTTAPGVTLLGNGSAFPATLGTATIAANPTTGGVTKTGNGTLTLTGIQDYARLTTSQGTTNVNAAVGTGTSTVNANATTNFAVSQTLGALNIGTVMIAALEAPRSLADVSADTSASASVVPEPAALGLLVIGALGLLGRRRRR